MYWTWGKDDKKPDASNGFMRQDLGRGGFGPGGGISPQ